MQRLKKLYQQQGQPLTAEELRQVVEDQFPTFKPSVLKRAARVNHPLRLGKKVLWGGVILAGVVGVVWVANLPYAIIRQPVLKTVPILLFPSYLRIDHNYRQAISASEQADQLLNQATTQDDIRLGEQKVQKAQTHLDRLPVEFLGNSPQLYCSLINCRWQFTVDEYETVRQNIEGIEGQILQEKNAFMRLNEAQSAVKTAKQSYQKSPEGGERQTAIETWQAAVDLLQQIPSQTVAGQQAQTMLTTAQQDFQNTVGFSVQTQKGNTMIAAAQQYAILAARASQNPPHTAQEWQEVIELWEKAIERLENVPEENPNYSEAQEKLDEYTQNLRTIRRRLQEEEESVELLKEAKELIAEWREMAQESNPSISRLRRQLNQVINTLEDVEAGTTVTQEAQDLLRATRNTRNKL
jgi:tetratricopeptide (TPR) repeat protein